VSSALPSRHTPAPAAPDPEALAGPALRTFFRIAQAWDLSAAEQMVLLGDPPRSTFYKWREQSAQGPVARLPRDVLERISYVLGIWKALQVLFPDPARADGWIRRPNDAPPFGGRPALALMLSGNVADLYLVRRYLDAERGGWP
jgi:hypothetical protein